MEALIGLGIILAYGLGGAFTCGLFGCTGEEDAGDAWLFFFWPAALVVCAIVWVGAKLFTGAFWSGKALARLVRKAGGK